MTFSAETWSDIWALSEPQFVPGQDAISYLNNGPENVRLLVAPIGRGAPAWLPLWPRIIGAPGSGLGAYGWLPDGSALVYIGVDERLHWHDVATGMCRPLSKEPKPLSGLTVSPTGAHVAVAVDTRFICVLSLLDRIGELTRVSTSGDFAMDPAWSPDGKFLAWHEWDFPHMPWHESRIVVGPVDGSQPPATAVGGVGAVAQPRFSPAGGRLGFLSDRDGWLTLWSLEFAHGLAGPVDMCRPFVTCRAELAPPSWGPGLRTWAWTAENEVVVWRNENGCGALERWKDGVRSAVLRDGVVAEGVASRDGEVAAVVSGPTASPRIEFTAGSQMSVAAVSSPLAVDRAGPVPELVNWASDGHMIDARLYRPQARGEEPPPLLVWLHQGPTGQTRATLEPRIAYFVERGWAVLVPDHRGSTGRGRDFMLALDGHWGEDDVADVVAGIKVAAQKGWGDANRVALYGGSAGGFLLLRLLATHPSLCSAGVALFPVCHLLDADTPPWRYQTYYVERLLGGRPTERSDVADRSPLKYPGRIRRPILILHGSDDHIVPAWHSEALADAVNAAGGIAERHVYQGEGHGWAGGKTLADELRRVESFLERHVLSARRPN